MEERLVIGGIALGFLLVAFLCGCLWNLIFYIGLIRLALIAVSMVKGIKEHFLMKPLDHSKRYGKGSWALVTGAANGIGLEYAKQLADKDFNLLLVDLDEQGLKNAKEAIQTKNPNVKIESFTSDLTKLDNAASVHELLGDALDNDISVLVNNAGFASVAPFHDKPASVVQKIIHIH